MYKVIDNLFISDVGSAQNELLLTEVNSIKAVLSIMSFNLPLKLDHIVYKHIELMDMESEDILSHFEESFTYISDVHFYLWSLFFRGSF